MGGGDPPRMHPRASQDAPTASQSLQELPRNLQGHIKKPPRGPQAACKCAPRRPPKVDPRLNFGLRTPKFDEEVRPRTSSSNSGGGRGAKIPPRCVQEPPKAPKMPRAIKKYLRDAPDHAKKHPSEHLIMPKGILQST